MRGEIEMRESTEILAEKHASQQTNLSTSALRRWHDRLSGLRDSGGRRLYTLDLVDEICLRSNVSQRRRLDRGT